jgi:rhomboid family GlyGly-CTERM serine protease
MGLRDRLEIRLKPRMRWNSYWLVCVLLIAVCGCIALFGDRGRALLMYDRLAITDGEYWRLLTGHLAHLGYSHLLLNLAGLVLVWLLVGRYFTTSRWFAVFAISVIGASAGFWFLDENMLWYVGLSGILHGLIVAGAITGIRELPGESAVILAFVAGKLLWEQLAGPLPGSESASGGTVIVNAHLYGAIGGVIAAGILWRRDSQSTSI